jgi:hypothetical protein
MLFYSLPSLSSFPPHAEAVTAIPDYVVKTCVMPLQFCTIIP